MIFQTETEVKMPQLFFLQDHSCATNGHLVMSISLLKLNIYQSLPQHFCPEISSVDHTVQWFYVMDLVQSSSLVVGQPDVITAILLILIYCLNPKKDIIQMSLFPKLNRCVGY